ncbi:MAG TPA: hypothetical protein VF624_10075 [Tepidisphaeraceae bacterium]|jgi:hypothetical protein
MAYWVSIESAAEMFGLTRDAVAARMIAGYRPMRIEHGQPQVDPTGVVQWVDVKSEDPVVGRIGVPTPAAPAPVLPAPVLPESALPRTDDGSIDVDAIELDVIEPDTIALDYRTARAATARRRTPPAH